MNITKSKEILDYWLPKNGEPDYDKWFIANDLRSVIRELVPLKDDNRDG